MKQLLMYFKDYKKEAVLAPFFKMMEATFELFVPLVVKALIDQGIPNRDVPYILQCGGLLVLLAVIGLTMSITAQYFSAKAATGFTAKIKRVLFDHIQGLSYTELDQLGTSTMITRLTSDMNQVQNGVNLVLRLFLRSPFIVFGAMIMAFTIDAQAAFVFVVTIPLLSVIVFGIMLVSIPLYKKVQAGLDKVLGITRENLTGVRVLRAFCREEEEVKRFDESNEALNRIQMFVGKISALMNPLTFVIVNGAIMVLVWTGAWKVEGGILTQGAVVALVNYMSQILTELIKLANLIINVTKSVACGNRIAAILDMKSSMTDGAGVKQKNGPADAPAVVFDHASLRYATASSESLTDICLTAKKGQVIGVIGGTGSGKSSVVNLISRFYDVSAGSVRVNGADVKDYRLDELRSLVGMVPQKAVLFKGTIRDNLRWGRKDATEDEMWQALEIAQAKEFVEKKDGGLDAVVEQGGKNLSGGQRQRLTIARALVAIPQILILDDSASALDYATDAKLRRAIREMKNAPTLFIVSQRAASIRYADQILVLDDGQQFGLGTHDTLLETCSVYREIYESQFKKSDELTAAAGEV